MENLIIKAKDFAKRQWITAVLIGFIVFALHVNSQIINTLLLITALETMALILSGIGSYVYTKLDFTKESPIVLGYIFLAVHLLVSIATLGVYIVEFSN